MCARACACLCACLRARASVCVRLRRQWWRLERGGEAEGVGRLTTVHGMPAMNGAERLSRAKSSHVYLSPPNELHCCDPDRSQANVRDPTLG